MYPDVKGLTYAIVISRGIDLFTEIASCKDSFVWYRYSNNVYP